MLLIPVECLLSSSTNDSYHSQLYTLYFLHRGPLHRLHFPQPLSVVFCPWSFMKSTVSPFLWTFWIPSSRLFLISQPFYPSQHPCLSQIVQNPYPFCSFWTLCPSWTSQIPLLIRILSQTACLFCPSFYLCLSFSYLFYSFYLKASPILLLRVSVVF